MTKKGTDLITSPSTISWLARSRNAIGSPLLCPRNMIMGFAAGVAASGLAALPSWLG
jgi:hypothetical protein